MSHKQYRQVKQTNLMSKSRKNYQSGTYSRISNRYNEVDDSLTEEDGEKRGSLPQQLNGDTLNSNHCNLSSQVSPTGGPFMLGQCSSKRNSNFDKLEGQIRESDLNIAYFSRGVNQPQRNNPIDGIRFGTGSFENNSTEQAPSKSSPKVRQVVELDDSVKIFQHGSSSLMNIDDDENVSDEDEQRQVPESAVLQEIPAVLCMDTVGLNARRSNAQYSFTKNIDYDQITDQQKRRFLREKKSHKHLQKIQQIVPDQSSMKSSMATEEKENQVCSEFASQHVKFVARQNDDQKLRTNKEWDPKPKSILKQSNNSKTCIQNNVYQSAQFINKQNKFNYRKQQTSKGRLYDGLDHQKGSIEVLDQKQTTSRIKRENVEPVKKGVKIPMERSGSKKNRRPNNTAKFTYPTSQRNNSKQKTEMPKKSSMGSRKNTSPTVPSEGSVHFPTGKRPSLKQTQDTFVTPKFINYDVNAHRNVWEQYGKVGSTKAIKKLSQTVLGQKKPSLKSGLGLTLSTSNVRSPREGLATVLTTTSRQTLDNDAKSFIQQRKTQSGSRQPSKSKLKRQKSQERSHKLSEKIDSAYVSTKNIPSGYLSSRESISRKTSNQDKNNRSLKRNQHMTTTVLIQNSTSEQQLQVSKGLSNLHSLKDIQKGIVGSTKKIATVGEDSATCSEQKKTNQVKPRESTTNKAKLQKLKSIQIDLVSDEQEQDYGQQITADKEKSHQRLIDDTESGNEEQITARGSQTGMRSKEYEDTQDDMQQEKYKIWMQSIIDDQPIEAQKDKSDTITDPFKQPITDSKLSLTDSDMDPYQQKTQERGVEINQNKHESQRSEDHSQDKLCDMALTTETDLKLQTFESMPKMKKNIEQNSDDKNQMGPQRGSKMNRRSKGQRQDQMKDNQLSIHDVQMQGGNEKSFDLTVKSTSCMENEADFDEFSKDTINNNEGENKETLKVSQPSQEKQKQHQNMADTSGTPKMNKTANEKTLWQHLLDGRSGCKQDQSSSEITQFNQKDFQSSQMDETQLLHQQSRNLSQTLPSHLRDHTQSTNLGSAQVSPDNIERNARRQKEEMILMINERNSDPVMAQAAPSEIMLIAQEKKVFQSEQVNNQVQQLYSPQFGGINKVELRQSVQNSGKQSIPNSLPQSSSGLDSTRIIDEDQNRNSQISTTQNKHESGCQCEECSDHQQIQRKIASIPFDNLYPTPNSHRSLTELKLNFDALLEQHLILQQIRDLIEIRPSIVQNYSNLKSSFLSSSHNQTGSIIEQIPCTQAIEGLTIEERIKIQTLCQEWWDSTQEDNSVFKMALAYQQDTQEAYFRSSMQDQMIGQEERNVLNAQNYERSQCMRKQVVLQSVVIGMTAFFSMLTRHGRKDSTIVSCDSTVKQDLELRTRLSQLIKILYDQAMLSMSYALGKMAKYERVTKNRSSAEYKLHNIYNEYIHLLFINKKIQTEDDYQIFNHKGLMPQYPADHFINNEENRDFQLGQLSRRLQENCFKILDQELITQKNANNNGNIDLLYVLRDIVEHSADIDFQEGKNHIFEGISSSEALHNTNNISQASVQQTDSIDEESELIQLGGGNVNEGSEYDTKGDSTYQIGKSTTNNGYGFVMGAAQNLLVKTFKDDVNQIIQEESREESMSVSISMINSSKIPPDAEGLFSQSISVDRSRMFQGKTPLNVSKSLNSQQSQTAGGDIQQDFDKVVEIQEIVETEPSQSNMLNSTESRRGNQTLKFDDTDLRVTEPLRPSSIDNGTDLLQSDSLLLNSIQQMRKYIEPPQFVRVSTLTNNTEEGSMPQVPFLPPLKDGHKFTLILDLEDTLVHCALFSKLDKSQNQMNKEEEDLLVYKRPGLEQFLSDMAHMFEIVIFSSRSHDYTQKIVSKCIGSSHIDHILHADHLTVLKKQEINKMQKDINEFYRNFQLCSSKFGSSYLEPCDQESYSHTLDISEGGPTSPNILHNMMTDLNLAHESGTYVKDLSKLGRDMRKTIIVDNKVENFGWQLLNGICISEYMVDRHQHGSSSSNKRKDNDDALGQVGKMLEQVHKMAVEWESQQSAPEVDLREILQQQLQQKRSLKQNTQYFY